MGSGLLALLVLAVLAVCANSEQDQKLEQDVHKRSADDMPQDSLSLLEGEDDDSDMDKRGHLFRYGRGGLMRYGKRAPAVFRYGKRASVFRYGKRSDEDLQDYIDEIESAKRLFKWGKRSDDEKRVFRYGKRSDDIDDETLEEMKRVFRYGKRTPEDSKRRVFRFGKRFDSGSYKYGRDTRVPEQPHVPFRFGEEE